MSNRKLYAGLLAFITIIIIIFIISLVFRKHKEQFEQRVATELDNKRAVKYALEEMCKNRGYAWLQGADEFTFDCKHTKETCLRESTYPSTQQKPYYEWREYGSDDANKAGYNGVRMDGDMTKLLSAQYGMSSNVADVQNTVNKEIGGICIVGDENMRKFCEDEQLRYDQSTGKCYTTKEYCAKKTLPFCNGDCYEDPITFISKKVFGNTLGTALAAGNVAKLTAMAACPS